MRGRRPNCASSAPLPSVAKRIPLVVTLRRSPLPPYAGNRPPPYQLIDVLYDGVDGPTSLQVPSFPFPFMIRALFCPFPSLSFTIHRCRPAFDRFRPLVPCLQPGYAVFFGGILVGLPLLSAIKSSLPLLFPPPPKMSTLFLRNRNSIPNC